MNTEHLIIYALSTIFGSMGACLISRLGDRFGLIDLPIERSSHSFPISKGGAIGILAGFIVTALYLKIFYGLLIPAVILALVSLCGDRSEISFKIRLIVQIVCSIAFILSFISLSGSNVISYCLVIPLIVYIVGTLNFYNFMDGIDGLAGITGVVGFLLMSVFGILTGVDPEYVTLSVSIAFSCLGFLPYNIPKAKVFMGDVGSILLGFVFACMVVIFSRSIVDFVCLVGFLFPFYSDELTTMFLRLIDGDSLTKPHRRHLYQLLANEFGVAHWKISLSYGLIQLVVGSVLIIFRNRIELLMVLLFISFSLFCLVSMHVRYLDFNNHCITK